MSQTVLGSAVPDFELPVTGGNTINLADYRGQYIVLYFYPKDSTPGCTQEGQEFRDHIGEFTTLGTVVLGVSRDSLRSHENFKCKQAFPFELISDADEALCQWFGVIQLKNMYGKQVLGIERSTFLVDPNGIVVKEWRKVKVKGHVEAVLATLAALKSS
jgi:thioredoxin-dependent peroxiredoxin